MKTQKMRLFLSILVMFLAVLACSLPGAGVTQPAAPSVPVIDATKIALEILATQNAPTIAPVVDATKVALEVLATNASIELTKQADANQIQPTAIPTEQPPQATVEVDPTVEVASPTPDFEARMKTANILVYEDTQNIGLWISDALNGMGVRYTHVGDAIGTLMENLNSPVPWDLIIIGAESHTKVQGEFWDIINEKVARDKTALIVEVWYLDSLGEGKFKNLLSNCGVEYQKDWKKVESIYWLDSTHPLFSSPNTAMPLINYSPYWGSNPGDLLRLAPGSSATLLAGTFEKRKSDYGVLTTCMDGRVVIQTFSNHDFHHDQIIKLWQNYVTYTLKNRFAVQP